MAVMAGKVNGPEDEVYEWDAIDWHAQEDNVRQLRQRIFKATQDGDLKKVRNSAEVDVALPQQHARQRAAGNAAQCWPQDGWCRRAGRGDQPGPGGDGGALATPRPTRQGTARQAGVHTEGERQAAPARDTGDVGPRAAGTGEERSGARMGGPFRAEIFGFRPGRGCHDAIEVIFKTLCGERSQRRWILDADLAGAFDHIDHDRLVGQLGSFPAREAIRAWLKAGVMEKGRFSPTEEGTPQGGVISPLLLNVALHGMEAAAGVRHRNSARSDAETVRGSPVLVRYADDYVAMCYSREQADEVKARLAAWLAPRGLRFNEDKTKVVHVEEGFSFLGFGIRRYVNRLGGKLLIKPSQESISGSGNGSAPR